MSNLGPEYGLLFLYPVFDAFLLWLTLQIMVEWYKVKEICFSSLNWMWRLLKTIFRNRTNEMEFTGNWRQSRKACYLLIPSSSSVSLVQVHFFNSFFYDKLRTKGYDGVKRWTKNVSYEFMYVCVISS